jgi:hypothetical protein
LKKQKKNKKRNRLIILGIIVVYLGAMAYSILTVDRPAAMVVEPENASVRMDGVSKVPLNVTILDNNGEPMSGQEVSFKLVQGSGKVVTILGVTAGDGVALGEYQAGYGDMERTAEVLIENMTGLSRTVVIDEQPNTIVPGSIIVQADTQRDDILENGLVINATLLDVDGSPIAQHKLLFKVVSGSVGFFGFKMMSQITDDAGNASLKYHPAAKGDVVISVASEEDSSVFETISFTVK